jgi:methylated-DNA-[protein]-cysteine S-methyltransferase
MIYIHECDGNIVYIGFEDIGEEEAVTPLIKKTKDQLLEYFDGRRREFDIPLLVEGGDLQSKVCGALMTIPYGETRTYSDIAASVGTPKAVRAVATSIGKNPISIIIPCHRVIGSDGKMRGYAGGISFKEHLLETEGWRPPRK